MSDFIPKTEIFIPSGEEIPRDLHVGFEKKALDDLVSFPQTANSFIDGKEYKLDIPPVVTDSFKQLSEEKQWEGVKSFFILNFLEQSETEDAIKNIKNRCIVYDLYRLYNEMSPEKIIFPENNILGETVSKDEYDLFVFREMFIHCVYERAFNGSIFNRQFLINIYKEYYPFIYNSVKNRKIIDREYIVSAAIDFRFNEFISMDIKSFTETIMSFILILAKLLDKKIDNENCLFALQGISSVFNKEKEEYNTEKELYLKRRDELKEQADQKSDKEIDDGILSLIHDLPKAYFNKNRLSKGDKDIYRFMETILNDYGYTMDLVKKSLYGEFPINDNLAFKNAFYYMLLIMDKNDIMKLSKKELNIYKFIYILTCAVAENAEYMCSVLSSYSGQEYDKKIRNIADNIARFSNTAPKRTIPVIKEDITTPEPDEKDTDTDTQSLIDEIKRLKEENEKLKRDKNNLSVSYSEVKDELKETIKEKDALSALLSAKEESEDEDITEDNTEIISTEDMLKEISDRKLLIIGGHKNWQNRVREYFPNVKIIGDKELSNTSKPVVDGFDGIYIASDHIGHPLFYKYYNLLKEGKYEFSYIHSTNMDRLIEQVYKDFFENIIDR